MSVEKINLGLVNNYSSNLSLKNKKSAINTTTEKQSYSELPISYRPYINLGYSRRVAFMGHSVHIIDGGNHATNMQHFANAISDDMDISMHMVETNSRDNNIKQLKSLEYELKKFNESPESFARPYVAVPALASVPILNIQDQYNSIMGEHKKFTPENLKTNKKQILEFLKKIYTNPEKYRQYIGYMDSNGQGIEYVYGVIQEINKLIKKQAKVYIPSGHPQDETLKWMAGERGLKPELYYYIATGKDANGSVFEMHKEIKDKNWYDFNLLSLSDAKVVGVKGAKGAQDYMFAAYDSCVTDGARGVYNFSPVRNGRELIGYSYTDTVTNEYPFEEFPANDEVANLVKFVGRDIRDVVATQQECEALRDCIVRNITTKYCSDKLYPVKDVFSARELLERKAALRGDYIDKSLKLYFRKNENGKVIFPQCDCEGSGKPSVLSMWGSCFAVFNAIARDIKIEDAGKAVLSAQNGNPTAAYSAFEDKIDSLINKGQTCELYGCYDDAENYYNIAVNTYKQLKTLGYKGTLYRPYLSLADFHYKTGNLKTASACYNIVLDMLAGMLKEKPYTPDPESSSEYTLKDLRKYAKRHEQLRDYLGEQGWYDSLHWLAKMTTSAPSAPDFYCPSRHKRDTYLAFHNRYNEILPLAADIYDKIGDICKKKGEDYPAKVCAAAARDIRQCTARGDVVLTKRVEGVQYIGDLYDEISAD